jgi:4-hydroxy-3-methylbut-2-enyl diphosphate reductase
MKNKEKKILLSAPRGFCAGVERAIEIVEKSLEKYGVPVYVRHEIVHNKYVVDDLKNKGAIFVEELEEIKDKSRPVIFSAHGVPKKIPEDAKNYNMTYVDATCPLVSKVHREAENLYKAGYHIILIGHENHPEVIGTMGQLPTGTIDLIQNEEEALNYKNKRNQKIAYVTQTTLSLDDTKDIIKILKERFKDIHETPKEDICYATTNRQMAVKNIAKKCDIFFVIGSRNSSNSVRLVEVAKKSGCLSSYLIHSESEIPFEKIENAKTIGISSGASAPEVLVENFIGELKKRFTINIDEGRNNQRRRCIQNPKKIKLNGCIYKN